MRLNVFPACAGMILAFGFVLIAVGGVPRMRGDDPMWSNVNTRTRACSPHARG